MRTAILAAVALAVTPMPSPAAETVALPHFRSVQLRGGGEVMVRHAAAQRLTLIDGSSAVTGLRVTSEGRLEIDACERHCPELYRLRILVETPSLPGLGISGGGSIVAENGFPAQNEVAAAVHGGGQIHADAVEARSASAAVHGGGLVLVRASGALNAAVTGGGSVRYRGDPRVTSAVSGGGSVERVR